LTVTNPLFDPVSITLATPGKTPGKYSSTVTILCPEFEIGANTDVWDEALQSATAQPSSKTKGKRSGLPGTIWDSGRNWTSVIIEVIPPQLPDDELLDEREKIVQVPVLVRSVYETDIERDDAGLGSGKEGKEKKEQSYWSVLEVGSIGKLGAREDGAMSMRPVSMMPFSTAGPGGDVAGRTNPSRHSMR
jgi:dynactin-4